MAGGVLRLSSLSDEQLPEVLIVDQPSVEDGDLEQIERLSGQYPRMAFVLLCREQDPEFLLQAMRAGVREVLPSPPPTAKLYAALERIGEKLTRRVNNSGKVLAFISCKGGRGATFLATNLGYALSASGNK